MRKLINALFLVSTFVLAQEGQSVASVQFDGSGLSELETRTLYNYFLGELEKASDDPLQSQESVGQAVSALALETESCFRKIAFLHKMLQTYVSAGTLKFSKEKYRVKVYKVDSLILENLKHTEYDTKGDSDGFITELEILAWKIMGKKCLAD